MPHNHEWQSRIKAVEREFLGIRQATDRFLTATLHDPGILQSDLRHGEIVIASSNLEGTYIIRLFAEFESGARQFWRTHWNTEPRTTDLLDGLAARCGVPETQLANAHAVRLYRNAMVHEREEVPEEFSMAAARSILCRFFSFLPPKW